MFEAGTQNGEAMAFEGPLGDYPARLGPLHLLQGNAPDALRDGLLAFQVVGHG